MLAAKGGMTRTCDANGPCWPDHFEAVGLPQLVFLLFREFGYGP
jgi:hypothetical protein